MRNDDPVKQTLRDAVWRRALSADEARRLEEWLTAHPVEHVGWEEERALTRLLAHLPEAVPPTNFTARVLDAIDAPAPAAERRSDALWLGWLRTWGWVPRLAGVAVLVVAGYVGHHQYTLHRQEQFQRAEMARSVATISELARGMPSVETLQDIDYIRNLPAAAGPDEALLAALR